MNKITKIVKETIFKLDSSFGLNGLKVKFELDAVFASLSKIKAYLTNIIIIMFVRYVLLKNF